MVEEAPARVSSLSEASRLEEIEQTFDFLRRESELAHVLLGFSAALAEVKSVEETLDLAVRMIPSLFSADRCFAVAWTGNAFRVVAHRGYGAEGVRRLEELAAAPGRRPDLLEVMQSRNALLIPDAAAEGRFSEADTAAWDLAAYIALPLTIRDEDFGAIGIEFPDARPFESRDVTLARGIARQISVALANARQFTLLQSLRRHGLQVASRLRLDQVLAEVARDAADLVGADASALYFLDSTRTNLVATGAQGPHPKVAEAFPQLDVTAEPWHALLGDAAVQVAPLAGPQGTVTAVAAAVPSPGVALFGAAVVFYDRETTVGSDHLEALSVLAAHSGMAIENAQRFERQRRVARSLQRGLLLTDMPKLDSCRVATIYEPASGEADIGGDFFDVFDLPDGRFAVVVGDVSGKGAEAAAQTAMAKYMLRAFALRSSGPASVLYHLNNALAHGFAEDRFATLLYAVFEGEARRCTIASGGHPAPLVYRAALQGVERIATSGSLVGAFEDQQFEQQSFEMSPGDVFVAYTDGLLDVRSDGDTYGSRRVEESLARHAGRPAQEIVKGMQDDALSFGTATDDMVVFALTTKG
jgi:GAF domain-containing protein